jgi:NAD(P)H-dependent flavin oxidoreductase YrpB (nitropropane dioxygenase family)
VTRARRLSQAISEGDGISVLVEISDPEGARAAEQQGAEGLLVRGSAGAVRGATQLPLVLYAGEPSSPGEADAVVVEADADLEQLDEHLGRAAENGLECVVRVRDEEGLRRVLERLDPEILLLAAGDDEEEPELEHVLELLPDVPAGKLAIAELTGASRRDVLELERAGVDAVLVRSGDVTGLVGEAPPDV